MVLLKTNRGPFVYGQLFLSPKKSASRPSSGDPRLAVEILREFSSAEFVGKLYVNVGTWIPAVWSSVSQHKWFQQYEKFKFSPMATTLLHFAMEGSGVWKVKFLRDESDESGPYIAIGLILE